ncbi:MFS transporter [Acidithiobacillus ferrivorans]|uniref:MFS transporter n=1 Tax=Acidithiobacillus ferrivorans TaxID=160808 RepID=UPI001C07EBD1|nr:MFS transporter [Acidithiobacillus ferrivorans]MBU2849938.1 MFS transporter [Acidithiobacillus ferrivorans]
MLQKYISFAGLCLGFFIVMMDTTTVPFLYTTLMKVFDISLAMVAWVNNIYLITYAAFLLLGGRLGDFANRKIVVLSAYVALGVGAAISGAGQTFWDLIIGRALMGVGSGLLTPQSMAYISIIFTKGGRGTALGIWGTVAGIATATGAVVTQIFLVTADWRWVMWCNIPIALACFLIAAWGLPNTPGRGISIKDVLVSSVYGLSLAAVIVGIYLISESETTMWVGKGVFAIGIVATAFLIRGELWRKRGHILSPELWLDATFLRVCLISGLLGMALTAFYLPLAFLLDARMNFGPLAISAIMVTISLSVSLVGPFAGNISDRVQPEKIVRLGLMLFAIANALVGLIDMFFSGGTLAFVSLCAVMVIGGTGIGLAFPPLANLALGRAQLATVGRAAAFYNSVRQVLSALGGVIVAIIFDSVVHMQLGRGFEVTAESLRESSSVTAIASFACFLFIALSLMVAAYMSRSSEEQMSSNLVERRAGENERLGS